MRRAGGESRELVAQRTAFIGMSALGMNERAQLVDVLDRVHERRLPGGEQD